MTRPRLLATLQAVADGANSYRDIGKVIHYSHNHTWSICQEAARLGYLSLDRVHRSIRRGPRLAVAVVGGERLVCEVIQTEEEIKHGLL